MNHAGQRLRAVANWVNLSTPLGLLVARLGGARVRRGPDHLWLAESYSWRFPVAGAFTVGSVVLIRGGELADLERHFPEVLEHERTHAGQWAMSLGVPFLLCYAIAAGWSRLRTGTPHAANFFEVHAHLGKGGYQPAAKRPLGQILKFSGR